MRIIYSTKSPNKNKSPKKIIGFAMSGSEFKESRAEYQGICLFCGAMAGECEPDAREYQCEECALEEVYGTEELLLMGKIRIENEDEGMEIETVDAILSNETLSENEKLEKLEKLEITTSDAQGILQAQEIKQRSKLWKALTKGDDYLIY